MLAVEPSHFDAATAYAVVDLHRIGDYTPYVYRTHDYGKTWTRIVDGLATNQPSGSFARVVRNDPKKRGLLFAGTESGMYVSFDDGDHWQTLMQNLPTTSYRDLAIKDNDLVVATYGRGFWVIDDYSMLRQVDAGDRERAGASLQAGRRGPRPPQRRRRHAVPARGAARAQSARRRDDRLLARARPVGATITLDVLDSAGALVRHLSSAAERAGDRGRAAAASRTSGSRRRSRCRRARGTNRTQLGPALRFAARVLALVRDQRQPRADAAVARRAARAPRASTRSSSPPAGARYSQTVNVRNDPRSPATLAAIRAQHALQMKLVDGIKASYAGHTMATALQTALRGAVPAGAPPEPSDPAARALALAAQLDTVRSGRGRGPRSVAAAAEAARQPPNFRALNAALVAQLNAQDNGDMAPTAASLAAFAATCKELQTVVTAWERFAARSSPR